MEEINAIIQGCVRGDRKAQKLLYDLYSRKLFTICLRYASDYHIAEDFLQDGFVKIFTNISSYRGTGSFEGWMKRIVVNVCIEHYRKNKPLIAIGEKHIPDLLDLDADVISRINHDDVIKMLQSISPGYRTVFNLYVIEGYSHQEIAEKLGISEGTSKSQLARARYLLQKKIKSSEVIMEPVEMEGNENLQISIS